MFVNTDISLHSFIFISVFPQVKGRKLDYCQQIRLNIFRFLLLISFTKTLQNYISLKRMYENGQMNG